MRRSRSISKGRRSDGVPSSSLDSACGEADRYIANCAKFDVSIDPSVVIALKTKWPILQPSSQFGEGGHSLIRFINCIIIYSLTYRCYVAFNGNS